MGGEKSLSVSSVWSRTGSPPHGRGKAIVLFVSLSIFGITPAWAGKSNAIGYTPFLYRDHPRMGGEK